VCVCVRESLCVAEYDRITKLATGVPRGPRLSTVQRRQYYSTHTRIYWNFRSLFLYGQCVLYYMSLHTHACLICFHRSPYVLNSLVMRYCCQGSVWFNEKLKSPEVNRLSMNHLSDRRYTNEWTHTHALAFSSQSTGAWTKCTFITRSTTVYYTYIITLQRWRRPTAIRIIVE